MRSPSSIGLRARATSRRLLLPTVPAGTSEPPLASRYFIPVNLRELYAVLCCKRHRYERRREHRTVEVESGKLYCTKVHTVLTSILLDVQQIVALQVLLSPSGGFAIHRVVV